MLKLDAETLGLAGCVLLLLIAATVVVFVLRRRADSGVDPALIQTFWVRLRAWWLLFAGLAGALLIGQAATVILFWLISFWALREFITLTPTRLGDHRALFWVFVLWTPLQFFLVGMEGRWIFNPQSRSYLGLSSYDLYSILIPVYAFLFILARVAMSGDTKRFLERTAKIQAGLLICVYCLSYAPALLTLEIPDYDAAGAEPQAFGRRGAARPSEPPLSGAVAAAAEPAANGAADLPPGSPDRKLGQLPASTPRRKAGGPVRLLFFFVLMTQLSDALQYVWSKLPSRHVIVPTISQTRTWEGFLGGTASVTLLGTALWFITTPFFHWWQAALMSLVIALMGFAGGLTMSAIKRDRGVKDFGTLVEGHGGVLDRIDSICFAAPVFFHLARFLLIGELGPTGT